MSQAVALDTPRVPNSLTNAVWRGLVGRAVHIHEWLAGGFEVRHEGRSFRISIVEVEVPVDRAPAPIGDQFPVLSGPAAGDCGDDGPIFPRRYFGQDLLDIED